MNAVNAVDSLGFDDKSSQINFTQVDQTMQADDKSELDMEQHEYNINGEDAKQSLISQIQDRFLLVAKKRKMLKACLSILKVGNSKSMFNQVLSLLALREIGGDAVIPSELRRFLEY